MTISTYTVMAGTQSRSVFIPAGAIITVTPGAGATATPTYTKGSRANINNSTAAYVAWPKGPTTAAVSDLTNTPIHFLVAATGGSVAVSIDDEPNPLQLAAFHGDFGGFASLVMDSTGAITGVLNPVTGAAASIGGGAKTYQRQISTCCQMPTDINGSAAKSMMTRKAHFIRSGGVSVKYLVFVFANFYVGVGNAEVGPGSATSFTCGVESIAGITVQGKFGGNIQGTAADNGYVVSDSIPVDLQDGDMFFSRSWALSASAVPFSNRNITNQFPTYSVFSGGTTPDLTANSGTSGLGVNNVSCAPIAILGLSARGSVILLGDSIFYGSYDSNSDKFNNAAWGERTFGRTHGYINLAFPNTRADQFSSYTNRVAISSLAGQGSTVVCNWGRNDFDLGGKTAAQVAASLATVAAVFPNNKFVQGTILPKTTDATNAFKTTATQVVVSSETDRVALNTSIRKDGITGQSGHLDASLQIETVNTAGNPRCLNGGLWIPVSAGIEAATGEGLHPVSSGSQLIADGLYGDVAKFL